MLFRMIAYVWNKFLQDSNLIDKITLIYIRNMYYFYVRVAAPLAAQISIAGQKLSADRIFC